MATNKDVVVIIFDVGKNALDQETADGLTFLEEAKKCAEKIIEKKIFTKPKDEIAMLLIGTNSTYNALGYEHISNGFAMAPAHWDMIRYVRSIDASKNTVTADWLAAILVAMDYLKSLSYTRSNFQIILMTTFSTPIDDNMEKVVAQLKKSKIELTAISSNIVHNKDDEKLEYPAFSQTIAKDDVRLKSELLIIELIKRTDGILCSLRDAVAQLQYLDKKQGRRVPWNCDLEIGKNLAIKIAAYIYIREETYKGMWKSKFIRSGGIEEDNGVGSGIDIESGNGNDIGSASGIDIESGNGNDIGSASGIDIGNGNGNINERVDEIGNENIESVMMETDYFLHENAIKIPEYIKGFKYGGEFVPFEDDGQPKNGRKSLLCIGFTKKMQISDFHLAGSGVWAVVPQKKCPASANMMTALATIMRETDVAMIARYAYNASSAPKMMVLFPNDLNKKHPAHNSLLMHELFFKQNHVKIRLPALCTMKTKPSSEQYEVIDNLIDSMDLDSCKAFKRLYDPHLQHLYRSMKRCALEPEKQTTEMDDDIQELLYMPRNLQEQVKPLIEKAKKLFNLEMVQKSTRNACLKTSSADVGLVDSAGAGDAITEVGTATPAEDFVVLMNRGERFPILDAQMRKAINTIAFQSMELPEEKISEVLKVYRNAAKTKGPFRYNEWITDFKTQLLERGKVDVWQKIIVAERYGLITDTESVVSSVTDNEAVEFYQFAYNNANNAVGGVDDMFDDL